MNKAQEKAVARIREEALKAFDYSRGKGKYEMKQFKVDECEYFVAVVAEVGMIGDEGTLASIICRDRVQFFIGKKGGITYPVWNQKTRKQTCRRFTGNYYSVSLAQK